MPDRLEQSVVVRQGEQIIGATSRIGEGVGRQIGQTSDVGQSVEPDGAKRPLTLCLRTLHGLVVLDLDGNVDRVACSRLLTGGDEQIRPAGPSTDLVDQWHLGQQR